MECSEASGVDHFHAAEVDHDSTGLGRKLGKFAGKRGSFSAISDSAFAADHSHVFGYSGFETQPQLRLLRCSSHNAHVDIRLMILV